MEADEEVEEDDDVELQGDVAALLDTTLAQKIYFNNIIMYKIVENIGSLKVFNVGSTFFA